MYKNLIYIDAGTVGFIVSIQFWSLLLLQLIAELCYYKM